MYPKNLIGFFKRFMSRAASPMATGGSLESRTEWKVFIGGRVGQGSYQHKKRKDYFGARSSFFGGKNRKSFYLLIFLILWTASPFCGGWEGPMLTDDCTKLDVKNLMLVDEDNAPGTG